MTAKNILILSASQIVPTISGGTVRTAGVARALARMGHDVRIFCLAGRREAYAAGSQDGATLDVEPRLVQETHLGWTYAGLQILFRRLGMPRIWQFHLLRRGWVPRRLRACVADADVVICDMPHTPPLPRRQNNQPWILMSHDLTWHQLAIGGGVGRLFTRWMHGVEASAPQRYDDIIAVTQEDRDFFRAHDPCGRLALPIIGSAVDPAEYRAEAGVRQRTRAALGIEPHERVLLFSGSRFMPNLQAWARIQAYCEANQAWLRSRGIRVLVVGSIEPEPYRRGVLICAGRVAQITAYFAAADAGFNPVDAGSGANVKLFEYLAARLPVISTDFGVRGSELTAGVDYIRCEPVDYTSALTEWTSRTGAAWGEHAEQVWQRHRHYCDIGLLTRRATEMLPGF
jgi:glycosyltransferase involved in cell wall biosynthesis